MKRTAMLTVFSILALASCVATTTMADSLVGYLPGRVLLDLEPGFTPTVTKTAAGLIVDDSGFQRLNDRFAAETLEPLHATVISADKAAADVLRRQWVVEMDRDADLDEAVAAYTALPGVRQAYKDEIRTLHIAVPDDPLLVQQWYLRNLGYGNKDIRWMGGWAEAQGDSNIVIAIIDSGVDWQHPDLGGTNADHTDGCIWINWTEYFGTPGVDDDSNGRLDDIRGWDFVTNSTSPWPGEDATVADNDPMDFAGHGTGCAGCAAAVTDNGVGISGTSGGSNIMALRAGWLRSDGIGVVSMAFVAQAITYATSMGADIINCSWGSSSYLYSSLNNAVANGVVIVNAAGNDSDDIPEYLDTYSGSISVAALNQYDQKASFSNYGIWVEISAPGDNIHTTWYNHGTASSTYATVDGTSFSSPITCGVIALLWSADPGLTRTEVINLMYDTCDNLDAANPSLVGWLGAGRANLLTALGDNFQKVPDEFADYFDAVNEAAPGDTIAVRGSHGLSGPVTIWDKSLYHLGGWDETYDTRDPAGNPTVITGTSSTTAMLVPDSIGPDVVVDGFRCTGGTGQYFNGIPYTGSFGGGIVINGDAILRNIDVTGNGTGNIIEGGGGGGVIFNDSAATMENSTIHDNTSLYGCGVYVYGGSPTLVDCDIYDNAPSDNFLFYPLGGGLYVTDTDLTMTGCRVYGHTGLRSGGGLYVADNAGATALDMSLSVVSGNSATDTGGGLYLSSTGVNTLTGNTFVDNDAASAGGGIYILSSTATLANNIVAFNTGTGVEASASALNLTCNDVYGNTAAEYAGVTDPTGSDGNVSVDPAFCDAVAGDYTIEDTSPCMPAQSGGCGQIGALGQGCTGGTGIDDGPGQGPAPSRFAVEPNFPNPFNPSTMLRFSLPEASVTTLRVYDVAGRLVRTLIDGEMPAAVHAVEWRGESDDGRRVAAGVYFYRIRAGDHSHIGQMALIK
ncbi:S8 family serine peptidase [bacterium]|nr:S8 family serine peptidase [bacterium]